MKRPSYDDIIEKVCIKGYKNNCPPDTCKIELSLIEKPLDPNNAFVF